MSVIISNYMGMEQALKTPTEEEICEALGEWCDSKIIYLNNEFIMRGSTIIYKNINVIHIKIGLPPHLITMIGLFYEGKVNDE